MEALPNSKAESNNQDQQMQQRFESAARRPGNAFLKICDRLNTAPAARRLRKWPLLGRGSMRPADYGWFGEMAAAAVRPTNKPFL